MDVTQFIENAIYCLENNSITLGQYKDMVRPFKDALPITHGHWIKGGETYIELHTVQEHICSICGNRTLEAGNYCGNCGAKMDESEAKK